MFILLTVSGITKNEQDKGATLPINETSIVMSSEKFGHQITFGYQDVHE